MTSIDIGPTITTKILTENGQVLHRSIYRPLTLDEISDKDGSDAYEQLMARVSSPIKRVEVMGLENTPQYDPY